MSLTRTYCEWADSLIPADRLAARTTLAQLGASWDDVVRLEPNRSLPLLLSPDCHPTIPEEVVQRFVTAHRLAGFFGFLLDRLADSQLESSHEIAQTCRLLGVAWHDALSAALGDWGKSATVVRRSLRLMREGTALEKICLRDGTLEPFYAQISRLKNGWVAASSVAMLERHGPPGAARALARSYDCFLFALQCHDDVDDADDDAGRLGRSIPEALGLPAGALLRSVPLLLARAADEARAGGLATFARWLESFDSRLGCEYPSRDFQRDSLLAMIVAARMDQELAVTRNAERARN